MTPDRIKALIASTGLDRRHLARMLGYRSDNTLRQCEAGLQQLPPEKLAWLAGYAGLRARLLRAERAWLAANPPPARSEPTGR